MKTGTETIRRNRQFLKPQEQPAANVTVTEPGGVTVLDSPTQEGNSPNVPDAVPGLLNRQQDLRTLFLDPLRLFVDTDSLN